MRLKNDVIEVISDNKSVTLKTEDATFKVKKGAGNETEATALITFLEFIGSLSMLRGDNPMEGIDDTYEVLQKTRFVNTLMVGKLVSDLKPQEDD